VAINENSRIFIETSPIFATVGIPSVNPIFFNDRIFESMLISQRIIAETYITHEKKNINKRLWIIPNRANTIGNEISPDPIAVPTSRHMALICVFTVDCFELLCTLDFCDKTKNSYTSVTYYTT
jgi:hypothetical protein